MSTNSKRPLAGIRVVDLTRMLSGPFCTYVLAGLGAEIIKVEQPGIGDPTRTFPPHHNGQSHYFLSINSGKRSVVLDLKSEEGRGALRRLLGTADVLVENFRPTALAELGLEPDRLAEEFPDLVVCAISGFGIDNDLRDKTSLDIVSQAMSGAMSVNGERNGPPMRLGIPMGDLAGALYATIGVLASLFARERDPERGGDAIDLSLQDSLTALLGYYATFADVTGAAPVRSGSGHLTGAPYGCYEANDGYFVLAAFTDNMWPGTCRAIGREDLTGDTRFNTMGPRLENKELLDEMLREIFITESRDHWVKRFDEAYVPAGPVFDVADVLDDPHLNERGMVVKIEHPAYGTVRAIGDPLPYGRAVGDQLSPPAVLGEDTEAVLSDLGYSQEEISAVVGRESTGVAPDVNA